MRTLPITPALIALLALSGFAHDKYEGIRILIPPKQPSAQLRPPPIPLVPPPTAPDQPIIPKPQLNVPSQTLSLIQAVQAADTLNARERVFAAFPEYWAQVEIENDIDDLRMQLGMGEYGSRFPLFAVSGDNVGVNFVSIAMLVTQAWKDNQAREAQARGFQQKVFGLIGLAQELQKKDAANPGISIVLAKLDFMGKRVPGKLPARPDRRIFTENLKAWAVNPVFDTTQLGPGLMEICRLYEEY